MMYDDDDYLDMPTTDSPIDTQRVILWCVVIALVTLSLFHFLQWRKGQSNESISIYQQSIDEVDRISIDCIDQPLVIDYIEDDTLEYNMLQYGLYSPLGIFKHYTDIDMAIFSNNSEYIERHYHGVFGIKPDNDVVVVYQTPDRKHTSFIVVHPHNILLIPRWSYWRIEPYDKITGANSPDNERVDESDDGNGQLTQPKSNEIRVETYTVNTPWTKMFQWFAKGAIYLGFSL
jgi:hypothetical protein